MAKLISNVSQAIQFFHTDLTFRCETSKRQIAPLVKCYLFTFTWHGGGISGKCHLLLSKRPVFTRTVWRDFTFIILHCVDAIIILGTIFFPPLSEKKCYTKRPQNSKIRREQIGALRNEINERSFRTIFFLTKRHSTQITIYRQLRKFSFILCPHI